MNLKELKNTQELQTFLDGAQAIVFTVPGSKTARYICSETTTPPLLQIFLYYQH
jgi:hypothetical protein